MNIGGIGGGPTYGITSAMMAGPDAALNTLEANARDQATQVQKIASANDEANTVSTTPTRGQNLNVVV